MKRTNSFRDFLTILFKYKLSILFIWITTIITVLIGNQIVSPIYEVESSVMVNFGREYVYKPEVGTQTPYNYYDRTGLINAEIEILSSIDLLKEVVLHTGVNKLYPKQDDTVGKLFKTYITPITKPIKNYFSSDSKKVSDNDKRISKAVERFDANLTILGSKESNIIRIIFQHKDPDIATETINYLVDLYQKKHLELFRDEKVSKFLEDMVAKYGKILDDSEKQLSAYKKERAAFSIFDQEEILIQQRGDFDTLWKETQSEASGLTERLVSLEEQKLSMSESTPIFSETTERDRVIDNTKSELLTLQIMEQELLGIYKENSAQVESVRRRIKTVETFLADQESKKQATVRTGKSTAYQELEREIAITQADLHALNAKSDALKNKLEDIDAAIRNYMSGEQKLKELTRQKSLNEKNYLTYVEKFEEAKINAEMDSLVMTNIRVVHDAVAPYKPVKPKKMLNIIVSVILGGFAGIGVAFFKSYISQEVNNPDILEKHLGIPALATISDKRF